MDYQNQKKYRKLGKRQGNRDTEFRKEDPGQPKGRGNRRAERKALARNAKKPKIKISKRKVHEESTS
ncbi:unnamed protein product [Caenorhabditis nigoni]